MSAQYDDIVFVSKHELYFIDFKRWNELHLCASPMLFRTAELYFIDFKRWNELHFCASPMLIRICFKHIHYKFVDNEVMGQSVYITTFCWNAIVCANLTSVYETRGWESHLELDLEVSCCVLRSWLPGSAFIKADQLDPWIKDQIKITLLPTISHLQLSNFVSCGRACPSHMTQKLVTVVAQLWTAECFLVDPWSMDYADPVW